MGGDKVQVSPDDLRTASRAIAVLQEQVDPDRIGSMWSDQELPGSAVAAALAQVDTAVVKATQVMGYRYVEMGNVLNTCADAYHDSDLDAAKRLSAMGDLNPE
ncbi:hypothetical protein [Nocardia sp. NPDC051570]|uniref:hypothetical protein n=1 Tax=Nocardia sp. NPDC051570 TaxID=3364324 RepID=UPI0037B7EA55